MADTGKDRPAAQGRARISPWPDRIALILIWLGGIVVTLLYQRPKGAGLYADFWFGAMITVAAVVGWMALKRALGLPPLTLKLRRPRRPPPPRG
jgi:4-hydroxybenzoate polyprenyltransferase